MTMEADPVVDRLEDQISWYDRKSSSNQKTYKRIKFTEIIAAAVIPFLPALSAQLLHTDWIAGGLGVLITILEGALHLNQYQENWIAYRSTCESLKHEKYVFIAKASPYAGVEDPRALLAERVESLVSQEHAKWASSQQESTKAKTAAA